MAIYHFSGTVISRAQGRSAVACAAYRSGSKLHDEYYNKTYDYTKKEDVVFTQILTPGNAPEHFKDRQTLWNVVEKGEKRKDAQLAREFTISLPRELTVDQNIDLIQDFVKTEFVSLGMIADVCMHNDKMKDGERQPHAHIMLTLREVTPEGFGQKVRQWNDKGLLLHWRESWAEYANLHLLKHGHDITIDHRTLEAQGIDLEPQHKIGSVEAQERLARLEDHKRIARENGVRLLENPSIALHAITHQQSTFTQQDIARFVNRHTIDAEQFQVVFAKVKECQELVYLGKDSKNNARFTTKEMLSTEIKMIDKTQSLSSAFGHAVESSGLSTALESKTLTTEQKIAFEHLTNPGDLKCVVGFAGTGKSYLLGATKDAWESSGYRVLGATLSGIAAENLEASSGIDSRTLASRFYYWDKGEQLLTNKDILVIDEAGMIGSRQMTKLLEQTSNAGAKIVLIGDPEQLQAIEAGGAFRAIVERSGCVELTDIRRQHIEWQSLATKEFALGKTGEALSRYEEHHHMHALQTRTLAQKSLIDLWNDVRIASPNNTQIMLAYTRKETHELNEMARTLRHALGELGQDHEFMTAKGNRKLANNDRIYFLKNDRQMGVMNGTLGTIIDIKDSTLTIQLDKNTNDPQHSINVNLNAYNHIEHGYAATIHKAQGVTVDRSYILTSKYMDRHATYVAASRHRESCDIFYSKEIFPSQRTLIDTLGRERSKDVSLDFDEHKYSFANHRDVKGQQQNLAIDAEKHALKLEKALQDAPKNNKIKHAFGVFADKVSRHDGVMNYLSDHKPQIYAKIESLSNEHRLRSIMTEEKALGAQDLMIRMNKALIDSPKAVELKTARDNFAVKIAKHSEVMDYFTRHHPDLSTQISGIVKEQIKPLNKGFERDERGL